MYTFRAYNFLTALTVSEQNEILTFCVAAEKKGNFVCIRVQESSDDMTLYGCYEKTADEVHKYVNAGGRCHYESPDIYIFKLTVLTVDDLLGKFARRRRIKS
jgi:predicted transport protein